MRGPGRRRAHACTFVLLLALGCSGPCGPIPGGRLSGIEQPYPTRGFPTLEEVERIAIEIGTEDPYSVHTWVVVHEGELFVPADFFQPVKRWPHLAETTPTARVRIGRKLYPGRLLRVRDPGTIETLRAAAARKYGIEPGSWASRVEVWWFRFAPRETLPRR